MFLGEKNTAWTIHRPGANHRARFMAKIIYCFKIFLYRSQYTLIENELNGLRDFLLFVCNIYLKYWYLAPIASSAPRNDLNLLKDLVAYRNENAEMSSNILKVFLRHTWYVNEQLIALSLFDNEVCSAEKRKMVMNLNKKGSSKMLKRVDIKEGEIMKKELHDFVSSQTKLFFEYLNINQDFLKYDPSNWNKIESYIQNQNKVAHLKVANDTAERDVTLASNFNKLLTKNENEQQQILQIVEKNRRDFPNPK